jgi:hypothetical protein
MVERTTGLTNKRGAYEELNPETGRTEPGAGGGYNAGLAGPHPEKGNDRTAFDAKDAHGALARFTDDELKQIPILPEGARLEEGATYLDLADPVPTEVTAHGVMEAGKGHLYVAKTEVDYELWNRLRGIDDPERTRPVGKDEGHEQPVGS